MNRNKLSLAIAIIMLGLVTHNQSLARPSSENQDAVASPDIAEHQTPDTAPAWKELQYFVSHSDIAFRGVVSNIEYKLAAPAEPGQAHIPFTFVTYDIKELIHGDVDGSQVVLRFIGGLDEKTMRIMGASHVPNFDLGDDDILFVQGNTQNMSPLVHNDRGRFRVIDGQVFSNSGREITLDKKGQIHYGKRHRLQENLTTTVNGIQGTMVMQHKISPDAVQQAGNSITADGLIGKIRSLGIPARTSAKFVNANIHNELTGPSMKPSAAPKSHPQKQRQLEAPQHEVTTEIGEMPSKHQPRNE